MTKSNYTKNDIQTVINNKLNANIELFPVIEGMESQVYSYSLNNKEYIVRINCNLDGFKKDEWAYKQFNSDAIPVPKIIQYGKFDEESFYCISEKAEGITYEDSDHDTIVSLAPNVLKLLINISNRKIENSKGYGNINIETGNGEFETYHECLLSVLNYKDWENVLTWCKSIDVDINSIIEEYKRLINFIPEERVILHGDFANNNLIVNNKKNGFSGVIDWDCCRYGNILEAVASANFWSEHLDCATELAKVYNDYFKDYPNFENIIKFFELRSVINEIYENGLEKDINEVKWCYQRGIDILNGNILVPNDKTFIKSTLI